MTERIKIAAMETTILEMKYLGQCRFFTGERKEGDIVEDSSYRGEEHKNGSTKSYETNSRLNNSEEGACWYLGR